MEPSMWIKLVTNTDTLIQCRSSTVRLGGPSLELEIHFSLKARGGKKHPPRLEDQEDQES